MVGPMTPEELAVRLRAVQRRAAGKALRVGGVTAPMVDGPSNGALFFYWLNAVRRAGVRRAGSVSGSVCWAPSCTVARAGCLSAVA